MPGSSVNESTNSTTWKPMDSVNGCLEFYILRVVVELHLHLQKKTQFSPE